MRVPAAASKSCTALFVSAMLLVASLANAQTDSMAKWKPSVGDRFIYHHHSEWSYVYPYDGVYTTDTTWEEEIEAVDSNIDSNRRGVVITYEPWGFVGNYLFRKVDDSSESNYPFAIVTGNMTSGEPEGSLNDSCVRFDFSKSNDSSVILFEGIPITLLFASTDACEIPVFDSYSGGVSECLYSPDLRWFVSRSFSESGYSHPKWGGNISGSDTLVAAITSRFDMSVDKAHPLSRVGSIKVSGDGKLINAEIMLANSLHAKLMLLDPLGRPIRSWALDVAAGESQVHLNVADVPSGVYFLRVSAPGLEDVKKVCIVH